jgi:UDP-MurNAc hydroxylase
MKTEIEFVNHASVIVKGKNTSILTDPWYQGDAFNKGWNLLTETSDDDAEIILKKITHIWISHEHPDHFSILFFKKFSKLIIARSIKVLFQNTSDKRVVGFLKKAGLKCIELRFNEKLSLDDKFSVTCIKDGFYDSGLLIENENEKILNLNDCEVTSINRAKEVLGVTGKVDVLLTQFSFAAWKGGKLNKKWRKQAAEEKLETMKMQIEYFAPKIVIPFASFIYFSNQENFYLNDAVNKPSEVKKVLANSIAKIVFMKPKDILGGTNESILSSDAIDFWDALYEGLPKRKKHSFQLFKEAQISVAFDQYCNRISNNNNILLMRICRFLSPISIFKPIIVEVTDLKSSYEIDYIKRKITKTNASSALTMKSEVLYFMFKNSFGFDTMTVNGCFEEGTKGGFTNATKSLAIENLNNLGIYVNLRLLVNFRIIKLFFTRLYRVARKLEY